MEPVFLGWIATTLFSLAIVAQISKTLRLKRTDGVSALLFVTNLIANIVALAYATLIGQPPLQTKYIIGIVVSIAYLCVYVRYRRAEPVPEIAASPSPEPSTYTSASSQATGQPSTGAGTP